MNIMALNNRHPVDSTTRTCCNGIGRHTPDCANQHGCRFDWCEADQSTYDLEHYTTGSYVPMTALSLLGIGYTGRDPHGERLLTVGVGARFNEDLDASPYVFLHLDGGPDELDTDYGLRIDEAVLLYNALGQAISKARNGTNLSTERLAAFYNQERS